MTRTLSSRHPLQGERPVAFRDVRATGTSPAARARIVPWPRQPDVAQLVLVDHHMVPDRANIEQWLGEVATTGARTARTNALFPAAADVFHDAGFSMVDTLTLLELDLASPPTEARDAAGRTRRMRNADLPAAAEIDHRAFGDGWSNDEESLAGIRSATPHHRSRVRRTGGRVVGFAINGRAGSTGYIQRLAVDPAARRQGHAEALVDDALAWMARRSVHVVLVNTAADNHAALALYRSFGFHERDQPLLIMERATQMVDR